MGKSITTQPSGAKQSETEQDTVFCTRPPCRESYRTSSKACVLLLLQTEREAHPSHQFKWGPHSGVEYGMGSHGSDDGASHGGHVSLSSPLLFRISL